jgi:hypothetical protein
MSLQALPEPLRDCTVFGHFPFRNGDPGRGAVKLGSSLARTAISDLFDAFQRFESFLDSDEHDRLL